MIIFNGILHMVLGFCLEMFAIVHMDYLTYGPPWILFVIESRIIVRVWMIL